jgi:hypothetical protein
MLSWERSICSITAWSEHGSGRIKRLERKWIRRHGAAWWTEFYLFIEGNDNMERRPTVRRTMSSCKSSENCMSYIFNFLCIF